MKTSNNRILVPSDGSKACEHAFRWACQVAKHSKSDLYSIYISEIPLKYPLNSDYQVGNMVMYRVLQGADGSPARVILRESVD